MSPPRGLHVGVPEHAGDFLDAGFAVRDGDIARRDAGLLPFRHDEVLIGMHGDLRQVRDHQRLATALRYRSQRFAHATPDFAADSLIHFVEDERRHGIVLGEHDLQREHQPR
jgi:hypothetical protein